MDDISSINEDLLFGSPSHVGIAEMVKRRKAASLEKSSKGGANKRHGSEGR